MAIEKTIKIKVDSGKSVSELNKLEKGLDKAGDEAKQTQASMATLTGGAGARFKGLISGIKGVALGFKSLKFAIAASGIGLVLIAITSIAAAFKNTEGGQNKFAKLMGVIGSVTGNLVDVLSNLGEKIMWVFENPKKAINDFVKLLKENIINRFEGLLELVPQLGKAVSQLFKGDFSGAAETAANAVSKVTLGVDNITEAVGKASEALKKMAAEIAADAKIAASIADQRAKADIIERKLIVERAEATRSISELRFKAEQRDKFAASERIKFLKEAGAIEDGITAKQISAARIRLNAQIEENKLNGSTKEDLNKVAQLKATLIGLDTSRLNLQKRLATSIITFQNEEKSANKATETLRKKKLTDDEKAAEKEVETENKRLSKIQEVKDFYFLKGLEREISEIERKAEADILELETLGAHKSLIEAVEQASADKIDAIIKRASDGKKKDIKKKEIEELNSEENILALKEKIGDQTLSLGKNLAKKGSDLQKSFAIAEVVRQQVKSVSETVSNTVIANAKAVAQSPTTGGQPFVGLNTASAALGIAGGLAAAKKAITNIRSGGGSLGGGGGGASGGGGGGGRQAPAFNLVEGTESNQIAEGLNRQNAPIEAFVVSSAVTNKQALERNIESNSTIG